MKIEKKVLRILILGYSTIAQKSLIPALQQHPNFSLVGIASQSKFAQIPKEYKAFSNYKEAILQSECDVIYISLHNSAHYPWIQYALAKGKHVMCDKPAVLTISQARSCFKLAQKKRLFIYESIPFLFHKQHSLLKELVAKHKSSVTSITAHFGFDLDKKNYRNFIEYGGGTLYDIGPNILSLGNFYFQKRPEKIFCITQVKRNIPISAAITLSFGNGRILQALIGYEYEYQNRIELWGETFHFTLDRAFSLPTTMKNSIISKIHDKEYSYEIKPDDCFYAMFNHFYDLIRKNTYKSANKAFLEEAAALDMLIHRAGKK